MRNARIIELERQLLNTSEAGRQKTILAEIRAEIEGLRCLECQACGSTAEGHLAGGPTCIEECERNRRRLDWLESHITEDGGLVLHDGGYEPRRYAGLGLRGRTLRDAIDRALARP